MAQSGFTPLQIYSSSTPSNVPLAANLSNSTQGAELAINIADGKLFYKNSSGVVTVLATNGTAVIGGSTTQVQYNNGGVLTGSANMTFNGTSLTLANDATIHGLTVGLGGGSVVTNTAVGASALFSNTSATDNTAIGCQAGYSTTTGTDNSYIGRLAGYTSTTGTYNVALGSASLYLTTTGSNNTSIGGLALLNNTTASNNTAVGYQAGYSNTTQNYNTFIGYQAGLNFVGTSGQNTIIGATAGSALTTGHGNTFVGGGDASINASGNQITTGSQNTILGNYSGNQGGLDIRTASNYIVLSDGAGNPRGVFDNNGAFLFGGSTSVPNTAATSGSGGALLAASSGGPNLIQNFSGTIEGISSNYTTYTSGIVYPIVFRTNGTVRGYINYNGAIVSYVGTSDQRLKTNIVDSSPALPVLSNIKVRKFNWLTNDSLEEYGLIAQELNEVYPTAVSEGEDSADGGIDKPWGVDPAKIVPMLVKAVQELNAKITALEAKLGA